jgi:hypothetical protein
MQHLNEKDEKRIRGIIEKERRTNGDFVKLFSELDDQWMKIWEQTKDQRSRTLLKKVNQLGNMIDDLYGRLRDAGRLGSMLVFESHKNEHVFIRSRISIKRTSLIRND